MGVAEGRVYQIKCAVSVFEENFIHTHYFIVTMDLEGIFNTRKEGCLCTIRETEANILKLEMQYATKMAKLAATREECDIRYKRIDELSKNHARISSLSDAQLRVTNLSPCTVEEDMVYKCANAEMKQKFHSRTLTEAEYSNGWASVFHEEETDYPLLVVQQASGIGKRRLQEIMEEFGFSTSQLEELQDLAKTYSSSLSHLVEIYLKQEVPLEDVQRILEVREGITVFPQDKPPINASIAIVNGAIHPVHKCLVRIYLATKKDINAFEELMAVFIQEDCQNVLTVKRMDEFVDYYIDCVRKEISTPSIVVDGWTRRLDRFRDPDHWDTIQHQREDKAYSGDLRRIAEERLKRKN